MTWKVLIIDDSLTVRMDLKEAFEAAGFETVLSSTGAEAMVALQVGDIHLAILDIQLPDTDGIELLKGIRSKVENEFLPIMFLSAESEVADRIRGLSIGANEYVGKPYDRNYIIARAHELLTKEEAQANDEWKSSNKKQSILIVDDSPTFVSALREALEAKGFLAYIAETGEEGLSKAVHLRPDAIIVDGKLPGIDGATVIRRIRVDSTLRSTPCLLLTASHEKQDEFLALESGADTFANKNEDFDVLFAKLAAMLRFSQSSSARNLPASLLSPKKVLAVDDSMTYINELADALREEGYDVIKAMSGEEALSLLEVEKVDCIVLDRIMPGLSGQETCRRIKAAPSLRDIPLLMLTSQEDRESVLDGFLAGADDYVPKSSELEVFKARLRAQIRRKQFEDDNRRIREELLRTEAEAVEARAEKELSEMRAKLLQELEQSNKKLELANQELEAFSYSVSHDLRAPLRSIIGFSDALLEDYGTKFDPTGRSNLNRINNSAHALRKLIDGLLDLAQVSRKELLLEDINLSAIAESVIGDLRATDPERNVECRVAAEIRGKGDPRLLHNVLQNLIGNAWKFTSKNERAVIEFGVCEKEGVTPFFVKDNGVGFDMAYAEKIFGTFQRLHTEEQFGGTGIGLATVRRIILRHNGRIWAEAAPGNGATIFFTLG
ncbi:MAG: response regulator [Deltaproteobacteria bacterium]|nr:response regulator [Deltaproteobacteria bacterium]